MTDLYDNSQRIIPESVTKLPATVQVNDHVGYDTDSIPSTYFE